MFGHHKDQAAASAKTPSQTEVAHQFDQTNGVMKAFDEYQANRSGSGGGPTPEGRVDSSTASAMAFGRLGSSGMI